MKTPKNITYPCTDSINRARTIRGCDGDDIHVTRKPRFYMGIGIFFAYFILIGCTLNTTPEPPPTDDISALLPTRFVPPTYTPIPSITPTFTPRPTITPTQTPIPTPEILAELVIITQALPAGVAIPPDALGVVLVPVRSFPYNAVTDITKIVNRVTTTALGCYEPIVADVLADREAGSGFLTFTNCPQIPQAVQPFRMVNMVMATMYLPSGTQILPNMVVLRPYPFHLLPLDAMTNLSDAIGQVTSIEIFQEQPITRHRVGQ